MDSCSSSALSNISKFTQKEAPVVPVLSSILKSKNPDFVDGFLQQQVAVSSNSDLQKHLSVHSPAHDWSNQFLSSDNFNNSWANEFSNQKLKSSEWTNEISNLQLQSSEWTDEFNQIQGSQSININTESNEQALRESASLLSSILKNSRNKKLQNSKLASFVADLSKDKKLDWSSEFNQKVENKQSSSWSSEFNSSTVYSNNNNLKADVDWSAEFNSSQQDVESRLDSLKNIENDWTSEFETRLQNTTPKDWSTEFQSSELSAKLEKSSLDDSTIYKFSLNNPYLSLNYQSLLTLASSESLQTSIWAIEAQLQQSITSSDLLHEGAFKPDQAALWYELGIKQVITI